MSISNRVAILAQSITFVYLLSFGQCELRVGVLVLIAAKSCISSVCVYILYVHVHMYICLRMHAYVSAGLSTYFYGLSARLHVFLRAERGQAHNSLGTAFIRSAAGVVIVVFSLFILCCCCAHSHEERASFVVVAAAWLLSSALKVCKRGGEWELQRKRGREAKWERESALLMRALKHTLHFRQSPSAMPGDVPR